MKTLFILFGMVIPAVAIGRHFGAFDGVAVGLFLLGVNQQIMGLGELLVKCTLELKRR